MKDFRMEYKKGADRYNISDEVLLETKRRMYNAQKEQEISSRQGNARNKKLYLKRYLALKTLVPVACGIVFCISITAFAYEKYYVKYKTTNVNAGNAHEYITGQNTDFSGKNEQNKDENTNITATLQDMKVDARNMYVVVRLNTADGSPLNLSDEDHITILERQDFEQAYFTVEGKRIDFTSVLRVDDNSKESEAVFELAYQQDEDTEAPTSVKLTDIQEKDATITLKNYKYEVRVKQNINFTYENIAKMMEQEKLQIAGKDQFTKVGTFITYMNGSTIDSYSLNAGNKRIRFSDQFPNSYIDNIGIFKAGEMNNDHVYLSIVSDSEEEKSKLSQLALFDKETGKLIHGQIPTIENKGYGRYEYPDGSYSYSGNIKYYPKDGRIILTFNAGEDEILKKDSTFLDRFTLVVQKSDEKRLSDETWNLSFQISKIKPELVYTPEQTIQKGKEAVIIHEIKLSDSYFSLTATASAGFELKPLGKIYLILSDGTKLDVGMKIGGSFNSNNRTLDLNGYLSKLADASQVTGIELWGNTVQLKH